ncbi:GvpL/GvpF family gas vesicle protein [soil metagenome]
MSDGVYFYGLVPAAAPSPPADLAGMADVRVELIAVGPVQAAVSRVPAAQYRPKLIEARLDDLTWVGEQGIAHERVVLWFVDHAEILPARLFSMYADDAALMAALEPQSARIEHAFEQLGGRREWNLKVAYDAAELGRHGGEVSEELRRLDAEIEDAPPGRRYLMQRKRADLLKQEVAHAANRLADELLAALATHADRVRTLPLAEADEAGTVMLNAALLVTREAEPELRRHAESLHDEHARLGMIISFSGPWAPYRFLEDHAV